MADPTTIFHHLQRQLFPALGAEFGALSALDQQFCEVMALTESGPSPAVGMVWQRRSAMSAHGQQHVSRAEGADSQAR